VFKCFHDRELPEKELAHRLPDRRDPVRVPGLANPLRLLDGQGGGLYARQPPHRDPGSLLVRSWGMEEMESGELEPGLQGKRRTKEKIGTKEVRSIGTRH